MSAVRLRFSLLGERWSIEKVGREGRFDLEPMGDDVYVARDESGDVVEVVIDRTDIPDDVADFVVAEFGEDLRIHFQSVPTTDLEVTLGDVDEEAVDSEIVVATQPAPPVPWRVTVTMQPLAGEPGVPVASSPQLFQAPVAIDPILARGTDDSSVVRQVQIEQRTKESELVVTVNGVLPGGPWWVRMSEGETGVTVALGRLEETIVNRAVNGGLRREPAMSTRMTYGLDVPLPDLHVSVSDTPLIDVGDREQRRRQWAVDLEARAGSATTDPKYSARLFADAAEVYESIGDDPGANRCRLGAAESRRRVRRRTLALVLTAVAVVAGLVIAAIAIFTAGDDDGSIPPAVAESTFAPDEESISDPADPPAAASTAPSIEPDPDFVEDAGPFELQFTPTMWGIVEITGPTVLAPGGSMALTAEVRVQITSPYDRIGCEAVEVGIPPERLGSGSGPVPTYSVEARRVTASGVGTRVSLEPFAVSRTITSFRAVPGSCVYDESDPSQLKEIPVIVTFAATDVSVQLPPDIEAGDYELVLINGIDIGKNAEGRRLAFRVSDSVR